MCQVCVCLGKRNESALFGPNCLKQVDNLDLKTPTGLSHFKIFKK